MKRRSFLRNTAAVVVVATAGTIAYRMTRGVGPLQPLISDPDNMRYGYDQNGWVVAVN